MKNQKKVLLFMRPMHGYGEEVVQNLQARGFDVTHYRHTLKAPKKKIGLKARTVRWLATKTQSPKVQQVNFELEKIYYAPRILNNLNQYDFILSIGGCCSENFMRLVAENTKSKKIFFVWDDLRVDETSQSLLKYFDETYCYTREDAELYGTHYSPNFYLDIFSYSQQKKDIDFFYVGSLRERERAEALQVIDSHTLTDNKILKLYGRQRELDNLTSLQKKSLKKYISKKSTNINELAIFYKRSKVLIDMPIVGQRGLGLRPIEAIGAKCKLLTTNTLIREYDFYNTNNIFILEKDCSNINLLSTWLKLPFQEYSNEINSKYSFSGFLDKVLIRA